MSAREEILEAADRLFGERGYEAASTREIAELSGVNKALIHYHFHSKEELFEAVLDRYFERLSELLLGELERPGTLKEKMERMASVYMDFLAENINFSRMVQREASSGRMAERIAAHLAPLFRAGRDLIAQAYPRRDPRLSPEDLMISFYGIIVTYFSYRPVIEALTRGDPLSARAIETRKRHVFKMVEIVERALAEKGSRTRSSTRNKRPVSSGRKEGRK